MVHVISGLQEGEEVLITPPLQDAVSVRSSEEIADVDIPTREQADADEASRQAAGNRRRNGDTPVADADREKVREQMANMSEEERAEFIKKMRAQRQPPNAGEDNNGETQPPTPRRQRPEGAPRRQRQNQDTPPPAANAQP